ncbi:MAG: hypothetical protein ACI9MR_004215, partial [Myxococcota bacterium]
TANPFFGQACQACAADEIAPSTGSETCTACDTPGFIANAEQTECIGCPLGQYRNDDGACRNCPANRYSDEVGNAGFASCKICPSGSDSEAGADSCTECPVGTANPHFGQACQPCAADEITATTGSKTCTACDSGFEANAAGDTCVDIDECTDGSNTCDTLATCVNDPGSFTCVCPTGHYLNEGTSACVACPANRFQDEVNGVGFASCKICPSGTDSEAGADSCIECEPGTANPFFGQACQACAADEIAPSTGSETCALCDGGFAANAERTECVGCPLGKYLNETSLTCVDCPANRFNDEVGATTCKFCPSGTDSVPGADSCTECPVGTANPHFGQACQDCGALEIAPTGGALACTACDPGFQANSAHDACVDIDECGTGANNCAEHAACSNTEGGFTCACTDGYIGDGVICEHPCVTGDDLPPVALCKDADVVLDALGGATVTASNIDAGSTDDCEVAALDLDVGALSCADVGDVAATLTVTDINDHVNSCGATITVTDDTVPQARCGDVTVQLDGNGAAKVAPEQVDRGSSDACGIAQLALDVTAFTCADIGGNPITLTVTDSHGNVATCDATVFVEDTSLPELTVPDGATAECSAVPAAGTATATDNCDFTVVYEGEVRVAGAHVDAYTLRRTWSVTDSGDNYVARHQLIAVRDTTMPTLALPADEAAECSAVPAVGSPTASDNCDLDVAITYAGEERIDGDHADAYLLERTWWATDNAGNTEHLTQTISIKDTTEPVLSVPADETVECSEVPSPGGASATDNCDGAVEVVYGGESPVDGLCMGDRTLVRTWTATDNAGLTATGSQTVSVEDTTSPIIDVAAGDRTEQCDGAGNNEALQSWLMGQAGAVASDSCSSVTWNQGAVDFVDACGATGATRVSFSATDDCGNVTDSVATFTIEDTTAPSVTCPDDISAPAEADWCGANVPFAVSATDRCGEVATAASEDSGAAFPVGETLVKASATDDCANMANCSFVVTVEDVTAPVIVSCAADRLLLPNAEGLAVVPDVTGEVAASDACGVSQVVQNPPAGTLVGAGDTVLTLTVTDPSGLTALCSSNLRVHGLLVSSSKKVDIRWASSCEDDSDSDSDCDDKTSTRSGYPESDCGDHDSGHDDAAPLDCGQNCFVELHTDGRLRFADSARLHLDILEPEAAVVDGRLVVSVAGQTLADQVFVLDVTGQHQTRWSYKRPHSDPRVGLHEVGIDWHRGPSYDSHRDHLLGEESPKVTTSVIASDHTRLKVAHKKLDRPFSIVFSDAEGDMWSFTLSASGEVDAWPPSNYQLTTENKHFELTLPARLTPAMDIWFSTNGELTWQMLPVDPETNYEAPQARYDVDLDRTALSEALCAAGLLTAESEPLLELRLHLGTGLREFVGFVTIGPDPSAWNKRLDIERWKAKRASGEWGWGDDD